MKIGIVGAGFVGATAAYAMIMEGVGREIVLVNRTVERAQAEAEDLLHAVPFAHPLRVRQGDYADLKGCRVVVITAGVAQEPGQTRTELLAKNASVFDRIVPQILKHAPRAVVLVTTNPVDALTYYARRLARSFDLADGQIMGTGTTLDTARFRTLLSELLGVDSEHIHAYVVGEHGDSEVLTWSLVNVGGTSLEDFCVARKVKFDAAVKARIDDLVRNAAYRIIDGKGATYYGIGSAIADIVKVVINDRRSILTVTAPVKEIAGIEDVSVALPRLIGGKGIIETFTPPLNRDEAWAVEKSAQAVRKTIEALPK
jgi:L-lactate dehydrogenase